MIESILINDFQRHKKLRVKFGPGVSSIVGNSDKGKSTILRALRWVCLNKPNGESFIRHGRKRTTVRLIVDERIVTRRRGNGINSYRLDDKPFKAFKNEVPPEIVELLRLDDLNFQRQLDGHFWFSDSAGQVSRELNKIVDLSIIDHSLSFLQHKVRYTKSQIEVCHDRVEKAKQEKDRLQPIVVVSCEMEASLQLEQDASRKREEADRLASLVAETVTNRQQVRTAAAALAAGEAALKLGEQARQLTDEADDLDLWLGFYEERKQQARARIPDLTELERLQDEAAAAREEASEIEGLLSKTTNAEDRVCRLNERIEELEKELHSLSSGRCPLCGSPMKS